MNKCHKCVFKDTFRDMNANIPVCNRQADLQNAIDAYNDERPCQWHITWQELIDLQEKLVPTKQGVSPRSGKKGWSGDMCDA